MKNEQNIVLTMCLREFTPRKTKRDKDRLNHRNTSSLLSLDLASFSVFDSSLDSVGVATIDVLRFVLAPKENPFFNGDIFTDHVEEPVEEESAVDLAGD